MNKSNLSKQIRAFFHTPKGIQTSLWLSFFVYWGGAAAVLPYIGVYYESVGLKGSQIGLLNSIPYFISMISSVVFAFLSDVSKQHKLILRLCAIGLIFVMAAFPSAYSFITFLPIVLIWSVINAPFNAILDETTLASLENPGNYGKIRVGGSIGWGLMVLVTGFLIDYINKGLNIIFYIHILLLLVFLLFTFSLPRGQKTLASSANKPSLKMVVEMIRQPGFIPFLLMIVVWGMGESAIGNFLFLHIKALGGNSTLMGTALSLSLIGEIFTFTIANKLHDRIGPHKMMLLSFLVLFAWLLGLSLIRVAEAIPYFQIFGGAGFALIQSGSVAYVNARAPKQLGTTAQAIRGGIMSGFGVGMGSLICGVIYETRGSVYLFRSMSYLVMVGFILGVGMYYSNHLRGQRHRS